MYSKIGVVNSDFTYYFNSILTKGKKDNTYKSALARFLIVILAIWVRNMSKQ